jgi:hypothetical protein
MTEQNKQWLNEHVLTSEQFRQLIENKVERAVKQKEAIKDLPRSAIAD